MAKATKYQIVTISLELTENEANYLADLTQNYIGGTPDQESTMHRTSRANIFEALYDALGKGKPTLR